MATGFASAVEKWAAKSLDRLDQTVTQVVHNVADRVIERSPIDTGLFRSNWQLGVDGPVLATVRRTDLSDVNGMGEIPKGAAGHRYFISNALPYALRLEYGFSGPDSLGRVYAQPPMAILGLIPMEFSEITRRAVTIVKARG